MPRTFLLRAALPLCLLAAATAAPLGAQTASLVKDIATSGEVGARASSLVTRLYASGGKVFFSAVESSSGRELWVSDGTGTGTELLADVLPGESSSDPVILGSANGIVFWAAEQAIGEPRPGLWRSDGTRAGTFALTPLESGINVGSDSGELRYALTGRLLFFIGCTEEDGCALWASDGRREGTRRVKDLPSEPAFSASPVALGGKVFFGRGDSQGAQGRTLWSTDGTAAGTVAVKQLGTGFLSDLTAAGGHVFFRFTNQSAGTELWGSDGTTAGTRQLTQLPTAQPFAEPLEGPVLKPSGRRVYFVADDSAHGPELWRSDGTPAGTERLTDFASESPFNNTLRFAFAEEIGGRAVFIAVADPLSAPKLWTSQGPGTTTAIPIPCDGFACQLFSPDTKLAKMGERLFFLAADDAHGMELWTTDGTPSGTRTVRDICPGSCSGVLRGSDSPLALPGMLLFEARNSRFERQLWQSDGTAAGTRLLSVRPDAVAALESGRAALSGKNLFLSLPDEPHGGELWVSESGGEPRLVADIGRLEPSSRPADLAAFQGLLYFTAGDPGFFARRDIWQSDGSAEGTFPITSGLPFEGGYTPRRLTPAGDFLFFVVGADPELWKTDGTPAGTARLLQGGLLEATLTAFQGRAWFLRRTVPEGPFALWSSDGTLSGTTAAAVLPEGFIVEGFLRAVGNELYFPLGTNLARGELWRSDGTAAGTREAARVDFFGGDPEVTRIGPRIVFRAEGGVLQVGDGTPAGTHPLVAENGPWGRHLTVLAGSLYFIGETFVGQRLVTGLWRSDGSAAGTVPLKEFAVVDELQAGAGRLFFTADDGVHGRELWTSDGSAAGTRQVRDIFPGKGASQPYGLTAVGDRLFFTAGEGTHGFELWQTDGTEAGTRIVQDIAPEAATSDPQDLRAVGDRLFFTADDGTVGRELWTLPLTGSAGCQPSPARLCLSGGRYQVEAVWRDFQGRVGRGTAVPLSVDTGTFWFFDPANLEAVVKVLDGQTLNGHVWVFYGALSSVEYTLTVTDTRTGLSRRYHNPLGQLASVGDTHGFGPLGAYSITSIAPPSPPPLAPERIRRAAAVPCQPGTQRLCLNNGRFGVEVAWKDFQNRTGKGTGVPLTGDTGSFWFFDAANIELVVKVLDGRAFNDHFWLFFGALSNVEYTVTVTDSQTGTMRTYKNPSGRFASVADTGAF